MFLVVGQQGSEARLVAGALAAHPDLTVAGGGELLVPLAFLIQRVSDPATARRLVADLVVADRGYPEGIGRHLDRDGVRAAIADAPLRLGPLLAAVFGASARAAGTAQAGTLLTVLGNPVLNRTGLYEGDVRLVHVVRDPRAVVARSEGHQTPAEIARRWDQANRLFRDRRGGDPSSYALVRYEDFARDPGRGVAGLATLLGIEAPAPAPPPDAEDPSPPLDAATLAVVVENAREGLFDFGYDPPARSPRRLAIRVGRKAAGARRRLRAVSAAARDRLWARRAPLPWTEGGDREVLAPAACNICRWSGAGFTGHQHAESADCPRCGSIARERFHLYGLGPGAGAGRLRVLETAPRLGGSYARAMGRWFDYEALEASATGGPLGHLAHLVDVADERFDRVLCAHDLQRVPDADAALAQFHRVLRPGGALLLQVPLLDAGTKAIEAAPAPGATHWSFGMDLLERVEAVGFTADLLVTDEFVALAESGEETWGKAPTSGEIDTVGVLNAASRAPLTPVADRPTARRRGWTPAVLFVTVRARRGEA